MKAQKDETHVKWFKSSRRSGLRNFLAATRRNDRGMEEEKSSSSCLLAAASSISHVTSSSDLDSNTAQVEEEEELKGFLWTESGGFSFPSVRPNGNNRKFKSGGGGQTRRTIFRQRERKGEANPMDLSIGRSADSEGVGQ